MKAWLQSRAVGSTTPRIRFGEQTYGNSVVFTVDGQETFKLIYEKMYKAKESIYIANYDLDPALQFVRHQSSADNRLLSSSSSSSPLLPLSRSIAKRIIVDGRGKDDDDGSKNKNSSNEGKRSRGSNSNKNNNSSSHDRQQQQQQQEDQQQGQEQQQQAYALHHLLVEKARQGVEVMIIVWQPRLLLRLLPGADERGIDGRAEEVEIINRLAAQNKVQDKLMLRIDSTSPTLTSAHHEKLVVIDNKIGFCGGLDMSRGKWDTSNHDFDNPSRDLGAEPWHDVHVMVEGPVVWNLSYHFHQRWMYSESQNIKHVRRLKLGPQQVPVAHNTHGDTKIVALRTWKELDRNGGIRAWYAEMFRKARRSIYIENQFPFQNEFVTKLLAKRLKEEPCLKVIIVGPLEPNLPGLIGSTIAKMSVNDVNKNLKTLREAGGNGRMQTFCLISQHPSIPEKRRQIYVHSKIMIVDDKWVTVGSANMDKNGLKDSSELNVGITSANLARQLRVKLWREHLGDYYYYCAAHAANKDDFNVGFNAWVKLANDNGKRVLQNKPIQGHVYYYNFDEMNLPPPYLEAKGATKFALI